MSLEANEKLKRMDQRVGEEGRKEGRKGTDI